MGAETGPEQAQHYFQKGYEAQMQGDLDAAIEHYTRSIEIMPTAEAHTFRAWALSFKGNYQQA
ncbi:MAG: tetratricopeptide repeat protein, partial [Candidatus Rokuibacteriota bacterium]